MDHIQGIDLIQRKRCLDKWWLLLGDSQSFGPPLLLQILALSPPPLLLAGHSHHLNLELPTFGAEISPRGPPEGPLNLPGTCCLPTTPDPLSSVQVPLSPLPFHCPLLGLKFACIFQICLDNMKMCCVYCWQLFFSSFLKSISKEPFIASSLYPDLIWFQSSPLDTEQVSTVISRLSTSARPSASLSAYLKKDNIYVKVSVYTHINAYILCTTTVFWP